MQQPHGPWFESTHVYQALLEAAPDAIVVVDAAGTIVLVNSQTERLFGYTSAELLGQPVEILIPPGQQQTHAAHVQNYGEHPRPRPMGAQLDLHGCRKDGSTFPAEISLSPLTTSHGVIVMSAIRDVTAQKKIQLALREAHEHLEAKVKERTAELEARNAELNAFAHTVAHDLKNPLTIMVGLADTLRSYHASLSTEEMEQYLTAIARDGRKMNNIIDELLVLASVGQTKARTDVIDMGLVIDESIRRLEYKIEETHAELIVPENWPAAVGHGSWLESVWANYMSNAIKYGGQPPRVELGATPLADGHIKFWVRDNGSGLSADEQTRLFKEFTRLGNYKRVEGHGVGLSIVRRIVETLGGRVGVESQAGQGSTFFFTLPGSNNSQE